MRLIVQTDYGKTELNYTWLPTWIGMNTALKNELEKAVSDKIVGKVMSEEVLDEAHDLIVKWFADKFPNLVGLADYLDALKYVTPQ